MSIPGSASPLFFQTAAADAAGFSLQKSVRFANGDSPYLNRTPSSASNRRTFTWAAWVKRGVIDASASRTLFSAGAGGFDVDLIVFYGHKLQVLSAISSINWNYVTTALFRDPSAWYHITVAVDTTNSTASDRVKIYVNGTRITDFGTSSAPSQNYENNINSTVQHAVSYDTGNIGYYFDGYMADIYFIDGSALDPTSFGEFDANGVWQAKDASSLTFGTNGFHLFDFENESGIGNDASGNDNDFTVNNITSSISSGNTGPWTSGFRDGASPGGNWGSASATTVSSGDSWSTNGNNDELHIDTGSLGSTYNLVLTKTGGSNNMDVFTSSTGSSGWTRLTNSSASITISSGTSSHAFSQYVRVGGSGSGNVTFSIAGTAFGDAASDLDVLRDVPTNGDSSDDTGAGGELSSNYCVWNAIDKNSECALANGNLEASPSTGSWSNVRGTIGVSSGKWYWEIKIDSLVAQMVGVATNSDDLDNWFGGVSNNGAVMKEDGQVWVNQSSVTDLGSFAAGDIIGIGLDLDGNTIQFYKNGTSMGSAVSITGGRTYFPIAILYGSTDKQIANFGQRAFAYGNAGTNRPAATFKALCTSNLPTPTIADGSDYFDVKTWDGNGSTQSITGLEFSPDWVWIKSRTNSRDHALYDTVRGATKELESQETQAESTESTGLTAFNSDGFSLGNRSPVNASGESFVSWNWDAGSSTASNTDGSVTSQVRVNQTAGFSIVSWTSSNSSSGTYDSIGHGLNALPGLVITKRRAVADSWYSAHGFDLTQFGKLNSTDAFSNAGTAWGDGHTSSVIGMRIGNFVNPNEAMIAYCFTSVAGYSAFGSYSGNGSTEGPFVYLGFRPRFILLKISNYTNNWFIYDTARAQGNVVEVVLLANTDDAESTSTNHSLDILSNGFKLRTGNSRINGSGDSYIYAAFAENPFQANGGLAR